MKGGTCQQCHARPWERAYGSHEPYTMLCHDCAKKMESIDISPLKFWCIVIGIVAYVVIFGVVVK